MAKSTDVVVDVTLTNFVREFPYAMQTFAQDDAAPSTPVGSFKGRFKSLGEELMDVHVDDLAGERAPSNEIGHDVSETTYLCDEYRLRQLVTDKEQKAAPPGLDMMRQAAINVAWALKLRRELRVATLAAATSNDSTPANNWNAAAGTIVADCNAAITSFKALFAIAPNTMILGDNVADAIAGQADIISLLQTAAALQQPWNMMTLLSGQQLPSHMFGCKVSVPSIMHNTAKKGAARTLAKVWGDEVYFTYSSQSPQGMSWARTFESIRPLIVRWRSSDPEGWYIKAVNEYEIQEIHSNAIWKLIDVLS